MPYTSLAFQTNAPNINCCVLSRGSPYGISYLDVVSVHARGLRSAHADSDATGPEAKWVMTSAVTLKFIFFFFLANQTKPQIS